MKGGLSELFAFIASPAVAPPVQTGNAGRKPLNCAQTERMDFQGPPRTCRSSKASRVSVPRIIFLHLYFFTEIKLAQPS